MAHLEALSVKEGLLSYTNLTMTTPDRTCVNCLLVETLLFMLLDELEPGDSFSEKS